MFKRGWPRTNLAGTPSPQEVASISSMQILPSHSIRVFVIAEPLIRWGLERLVQSGSPSCELLGGAVQLAGSEQFLKRQRADIVIEATGRADTEELAAFCAKCLGKVILVTDSSDAAWLDSAVIAGVRGVVRTQEAPAALLKAVEKVNSGELWVDRAATGRIFMEMARRKASDANDPARSRIATLTWRERETIAALASDASAPGKLIAERLCISEHTLRNHLTSIYAKLDVCNRLDLYAYAMRHGLHQHEGDRLRRTVAAAPSRAD